VQWARAEEGRHLALRKLQSQHEAFVRRHEEELQLKQAMLNSLQPTGQVRGGGREAMGVRYIPPRSTGCCVHRQGVPQPESLGR
jgi:hypothetical protein